MGKTYVNTTKQSYVVKNTIIVFITPWQEGNSLESLTNPLGSKLRSRNFEVNWTY